MSQQQPITDMTFQSIQQTIMYTMYQDVIYVR